MLQPISWFVYITESKSNFKEVKFSDLKLVTMSAESNEPITSEATTFSDIKSDLSQLVIDSNKLKFENGSDNQSSSILGTEDQTSRLQIMEKTYKTVRTSH
jgi:hypothetical protein